MVCFFIDAPREASFFLLYLLSSVFLIACRLIPGEIRPSGSIGMAAAAAALPPQDPILYFNTTFLRLHTQCLTIWTHSRMYSSKFLLACPV